jgi:hypothetical protein
LARCGVDGYGFRQYYLCDKKECNEYEVDLHPEDVPVDEDKESSKRQCQWSGFINSCHKAQIISCAPKVHQTSNSMMDRIGRLE